MEGGCEGDKESRKEIREQGTQPLCPFYLLQATHFVSQSADGPRHMEEP